MIEGEVRGVLRIATDEGRRGVLRFRHRHQGRKVVSCQVGTDRIRNDVAALLVTGGVGLGEVVCAGVADSVIADEPQVGAELDGVMALCPRNVVQEVVHGVDARQRPRRVIKVSEYEAEVDEI